MTEKYDKTTKQNNPPTKHNVDVVPRIYSKYHFDDLIETT